MNNSSNNIRVYNNKTENNAGIGISVNTKATNAEVYANTINKNGFCGISVASGAHVKILENNLLKSNKEKEIRILTGCNVPIKELETITYSSVTSSTRKIIGTCQSATIIEAQVNGANIGVAASDNMGVYSIAIPKQIKGSIITLKIKDKRELWHGQLEVK